MKKYISILVAFIAFGYIQAQDIQYVSAENGLVVRSKPSRGAYKLDKIVYGTPVEIMEHTNLQLDVIDKGEKISGEWVKIRGIDAYDFFEEGYVFNGFLTEEKLEKRFVQPYDEFTVTIEGLPEKESKNTLEDFNNIMFFNLAVGETIEEKVINIKHHKEYRTIEVFQKHENSIAISDEQSHCDKLNWQHYYSSWRPLKTLSRNKKFKTYKYNKKDTSKFIEVNLDSLKADVKDMCGASWGNSIKDINSIHDAPAKVALSKIFLRVVMTDLEGIKTEKIIIFDIPLDCKTKTDTYAKL